MDDLSIVAVKRALFDNEKGYGSRGNLSRLSLPPVTPPKKPQVEKELDEILTKVQTDIQHIKNTVLANLSNGESIDPEKIKVLFEQAEKDIEGKKQDVVTQFNNRALTQSKIDIPNTKTQRRNLEDDDERPTKSIVKSASSGNRPTHGQKVTALHKLKSIINPARPDARSLLNKHYGVPLPNESLKHQKQNDTQPRLFTGTTINPPTILPKENRINGRITPPIPTEEDKRKGVIHLIEKKIIPVSSRLIISPSPIKQRQITLHEPLDIKKHKHDLAVSKLSYNMALVKFDESSLKGAVDLRCKRSVVTTGDSFVGSQLGALSNIGSNVSNLTVDELSQLHQTSINTEVNRSAAPLPVILSDPKNRPAHKLIIYNGRTESTKADFLLFKQYYCLSWGSITSLLRRVEKLLVDYSIPIAVIDGERLADLSLYFEVGPKPTIKDLLMCVVNEDEVENFIMIPGRRYMAPDGIERATIKIQSTWRRHKKHTAYLDYRRRKWAAGMIALHWIMRCKMTMIRNEIKGSSRVFLQHFRYRAQLLKENWVKIKTSKRVIIHIPSLGYDVKIRGSMFNITTIQNNQIGRICDIEDPNVEVIFISPVSMKGDLQDYYHRLIDVMATVSNCDPDNIKSRLKFITPNYHDRFPAHNLCLSSILKYSSRTVERIKKLLKGKTGYIVPGMMHSDDLYIAEEFDLPILGSEPDIAQLYSMKSGVCRIFEAANVTTPPGGHDLYSMQQIYECVARLVTENLHIRRWLLKIDNQIDGRGTAYCDVTDYLECYEMALREKVRYGEKWQQPWAYEPVYNQILVEMPRILKFHLVTVDSFLYPTWSHFLKAFCRQGGIIQACPPTDSVTGVTANVLIEPDGNIEILNIADQVHSTSPYRCWGYTLPQSSIETSIITKSINSIGESCKTRGIMGYVSIDFVTFIDPETDSQTLWGIDLRIAYSSGYSMFRMMKFLTASSYDCINNSLLVKIQRSVRINVAYQSRRKKAKDTNTETIEEVARFCVFSPHLFHSNLNNVHYGVFFQMCKARGIGFDEKIKLGTSFTLMDKIRKESIGMITVGETLQDAVRSFACHLQAIHYDISSSAMKGTSNFQGAIEDLKSILVSLQVNCEIDQTFYPTLDPMKPDHVTSNSIHPPPLVNAITSGGVVINQNDGMSQDCPVLSRNSSIGMNCIDNRFPSSPLSDIDGEL